MESYEAKVAPIKNGTVIDHIPCGQALNVVKILGISENNISSSVSIGMHVQSKRLGGWKDIVKIEDMELDQNTVDKIALVAPSATISIIRNYSVAGKLNVTLDDRIVGLAKCSNPNCITNMGEPVETEFTVISRDPPTLRCCYCFKKLHHITDNLL